MQLSFYSGKVNVEILQIHQVGGNHLFLRLEIVNNNNSLQQHPSFIQNDSIKTTFSNVNPKEKKTNNERWLEWNPQKKISTQFDYQGNPHSEIPILLIELWERNPSQDPHDDYETYSCSAQLNLLEWITPRTVNKNSTNDLNDTNFVQNNQNKDTKLEGIIRKCHNTTQLQEASTYHNNKDEKKNEEQVSTCQKEKETELCPFQSMESSNPSPNSSLLNDTWEKKEFWIPLEFQSTLASSSSSSSSFSSSTTTTRATTRKTTTTFPLKPDHQQPYLQLALEFVENNTDSPSSQPPPKNINKNETLSLSLHLPNCKLPSFQFVWPSKKINWNQTLSKAHTNNNLLEHMDLETWKSIQKDIMYGNLDNATSNDNNHLMYIKAMQFLQLSTQYLDHCCLTLKQHQSQLERQRHQLVQSQEKLEQKLLLGKKKIHLLQKENQFQNEIILSYSNMLHSKKLFHKHH